MKMNEKSATPGGVALFRHIKIPIENFTYFA